MSRSPRKTLHVFISSPGDCAEERALLRDVVRRVSDSDAALAANVELQPLLWEDLPPGQAEPGDLQSRVNALLDRYGLKRFEIYAGAMKERLGTPTAKYRSGTIEELETALSSHRRSQTPAEVLFYFIDTPSADPEVRKFREELSARGFLYAVVQDATELEQRFTEHLTRIVREWSLWRSRIRRAFRNARAAAATAAAILLLVMLTAYLRFDHGGARRVRHAMERGAVAALAAYEREAPYLVLHAPSTRRELRDELARAIGKGTIENASGSAMAALWTRVTRAGIWSPDDDDAHALLRNVASRRLLEALVTENIDVADWPARCRPFELQALRDFASDAVRSPAIGAWPPDQRRAACAIAEAWPRLAELAATDPAAKVLLVRVAPPDFASRWIAANVTKATPDHEVHDILTAAETRGEPAIISALLDRLLAEEIDSDLHVDSLFQAIASLEETAFAPYAVRHLMTIPKGHPKVDHIYPKLVGHARLDRLAPAAVDAFVEPWVLNPVLDGTASNEYEAAIYRLLARAREARARRFILRQYDIYASERTSFGFVQKAALIEALVAMRVPDAPERALKLAKIAAREAQSVRASDWNVQAAYLRALAASTASWPRHAQYVRELIERRVHDELPLLPDGFENAAVDLIGALTAQQVLGLLALPPGIVSDEILGKWEPRWYILRALGQSNTKEGEAVGNEVFARLPIDGELRMRVARAISRSAPNVARIFLAREYLRERERNRDYLEILADIDAERFFHEQIADPAVVEAAARLPDGSRCRVAARAVQRFARTTPAKLWSEAAHCRIANDGLVAAAAGALKNGDGSDAVAAMTYLAAVEREQPALGDAARVLRAAAPFDWISLAQVLPSRAARDVAVETILGERSLLVVTERAEPGTFIAGGRGVYNPLLASYASRANTAAARRLLEWGERANKVEVLAPAADAALLYRAYCLWLAGSAARDLPLASIASDFDVIPLLAENNTALVRGAAAVCLGAGRRGRQR